MTGKFTIFLLVLSVATGAIIGEPSPDPKSLAPSNDDVVENPWEEKRLDNYLGYENCRKCHQMQVDKLVTTEHFKSFETVHRGAQAKAMCKALGIRSIKREARCIRCHYTPEESSRGMKAQSGISCESCHGPSKNWIQGHNDYGGLTITKAQETVAHRQQRIKSSIAKGMRHPSNLYLLARSCYDCHLIDDAELVNLTDHPPISAGFNMVAWSQGSMRHNFLRTDYTTNAESLPERLRVMFVVDLMAKLEATLRAQASSGSGGKHSNFLKQQYSTTAKQLLAISQRVDNSLINDVISVLKRTPPTANPEKQITSANKIRDIAFQFGKDEIAHDLKAIQNMLPRKEQYR